MESFEKRIYRSKISPAVLYKRAKFLGYDMPEYGMLLYDAISKHMIRFNIRSYNEYQLDNKILETINKIQAAPAIVEKYETQVVETTEEQLPIVDFFDLPLWEPNPVEVLEKLGGFYMLILGTTGQGKTFYMTEFVKVLLPGVFNKILLFSPNANSADYSFLTEVSNDVKRLNVNSSQQMKDYLLKITALNEQMRSETPDINYKTLIIFDDPADFTASHEFSNLISKARHYQISIILLTQHYTLSIDNRARAMFNFYVTFFVGSDSALDSLIEKVLASYTPSEFRGNKKLYWKEVFQKYASANSYKAIVIDRDSPQQQVFYTETE